MVSAVLTGSLVLAALALAAAPPTISGTARVGEPLTALSSDASVGTWQWLSCLDAECTNYAAIEGETASTYVPKEAGGWVRVSLTVEGEEPAISDPYGPIAPPPDPPEITAGPTIGSSPPPYVANTITATGTASGAVPTWQWSRCTPACAPIPGATSASYKVQPADGGHLLKVDMSVTNADGSDAGSDTVTVPEPPEITEAPEILPDKLGVGDTARSTAGFAIHGTSVPKWQWRLCDSATAIATCADIVGETTRSYVVTAPDAGSWLRVRMTVSGRGPDAVAYSDAKFIPKPEDPPPPPSSEPFTSAGTTPETPTVQPTVSAPRLLDPFPVVRIRGRTTRVGAQLTLLSVRAPRGARINVRCKSRYCPRSRLALNARLRRLRVFERSLRAGVVLEIRVMHDKRIGKYTRFLIRRAAPPLRRDACLAPGSRRPTRCPGG